MFYLYILYFLIITLIFQIKFTCKIIIFPSLFVIPLYLPFLLMKKTLVFLLTSFTFQISYERGNSYFWWYLDKHVYVIAHCMSFHNFHPNLPYISFLLYFGQNTIWYRQFNLVCDKLLVSSFLLDMTLSPFYVILTIGVFIIS